jgi:hypothetical protein
VGRSSGLNIQYIIFGCVEGSANFDQEIVKVIKALQASSGSELAGLIPKFRVLSDTRAVFLRTEPN